MTTPTVSILPMPDRSRLVVVAMVAMVAKMAAGAAEGQHDEIGPFLNFNTEPIKPVTTPMKKVKGQQHVRQCPASLILSMANMTGRWRRQKINRC